MTAREMDERKRIERDHYEDAAHARGGADSSDDLSRYGPGVVDPTLRRPYEDFATAVRAMTSAGSRVLDIGAGTGVHSLAGAPSGASLFATDIATSALSLAIRRARTNEIQLAAVTADSEVLPFRNATFNLVSSAGALYCFDFRSLASEITRILRPDGAWIVVDAFDLNPLYRLNRLIGYLRGRRTKLALTNIPNSQTLQLARTFFEQVEVRYYGSFVVVAPLLSRLVGRERAARVLDASDRLIGSPSILAFRFVMIARRPRK